MIGKRIYNWSGNPLLEPGEFAKYDVDGNWYATSPNNLFAGLANHDVIEHDDGTITVSPSILVKGHDGEWHGYLERGIWRNV